MVITILYDWRKKPYPYGRPNFAFSQGKRRFRINSPVKTAFSLSWPFLSELLSSAFQFYNEYVKHNNCFVEIEAEIALWCQECQFLLQLILNYTMDNIIMYLAWNCRSTVEHRIFVPYRTDYRICTTLMLTRTQTHTHAHAHVHPHTHTHVHTHTHTHARTHARIHTHHTCCMRHKRGWSHGGTPKRTDGGSRALKSVHVPVVRTPTSWGWATQPVLRTQRDDCQHGGLKHTFVYRTDFISPRKNIVFCPAGWLRAQKISIYFGGAGLKTGIFGVFWSLSGKNPCAGLV